MKKIVWLAVVLFSVLSVEAQNVRKLAVDKQYPGNSKAIDEYQAAVGEQVNQSPAVRTTWITNKPGSNWFISLEGGLAWLGSENYGKVALIDNLFPTGGFSVGKWYSPVWGFRVNATWSKLKGYADTPNGTWYAGQNYVKTDGYESPDSYIRGNTQEARDFIAHHFLNDLNEPYKNGYRYNVAYAGATLDFLLNVKNLIGSYDPEAFFNPVIHTGFGYVHTFKGGDGKSVNGFMGKGGLQFNFRLNDQWHLYIDGEALILPETFDFQLGGDRVQDIVLNVKIGVTYYFNFCPFIKAPLPLYNNFKFPSLKNDKN
jgi:hypothetical protein